MGGEDLRAIQINKQLFKRAWVNNALILPGVVVVSGAYCVLYIAYHHFWKNNSVVINKDKSRPYFHYSSPHILSPDTIRKNSMLSQASEPETGIAQKWVPYINPWRGRPY
jgi:hypothetical protein